MVNISTMLISNVKALKMLTVATVAGKGYTNISLMLNNLLSRRFQRPFPDTIQILRKWQITCSLNLQALVIKRDFLDIYFDKFGFS